MFISHYEFILAFVRGGFGKFLCLIALVLLAGIQIGFGQPESKFVVYDSDNILLQNLRVIDVIDKNVLEGYSILISHGKISKVERSGEIKVPPDVLRIDLEGRTALPGLVMLHEHLNYFSGRGIWDAHPFSFPKLFLAAGVTSIRTAGAENPTYDLNLKKRIDSGNAPGPTIFVTGPFFNGASGGFLGDFVLADYESARKATAFWADRGSTSFKVYTDISGPALKGVIDEAHSRGLIVTGHLGKMSCTEAAELGIDNIEHGFGSCAHDLGLSLEKDWELSPDDENVTRLIDLLVEKKVVLTVTPFSDSDIGDPEQLEYLSADQRERIAGLIKNRPPHMPRGSNEKKLRPLEKLFVEKGGKIVLGADAADFGVIPGFQNHNALVTMVKYGWEPMDVIRMATFDGADFLKVADRIGSIETGKAADLIMIRGEPDKQITDIRNIELVFKNGIGYDPKRLRESAKGMVGIH